MERPSETAQSPLEAGCCGMVAGKSMLPSLWPGDRVWIERVDPGTLNIGDVVLFQLHSRCCVHRIQDIHISNDGTRIFVTRGDARPRTDPEVAAHEILGKVVSVVRGEREISGVSKRALWNRGVGAALARYEPMASLASRLIDEKMAWKKGRSMGQRSPR